MRKMLLGTLMFVMLAALATPRYAALSKTARSFGKTIVDDEQMTGT